MNPSSSSSSFSFTQFFLVHSAILSDLLYTSLITEVWFNQIPSKFLHYLFVFISSLEGKHCFLWKWSQQEFQKKETLGKANGNHTATFTEKKYSNTVSLKLSCDTGQGSKRDGASDVAQNHIGRNEEIIKVFAPKDLWHLCTFYTIMEVCTYPPQGSANDET